MKYILKAKLIDFVEKKSSPERMKFYYVIGKELCNDHSRSHNQKIKVFRKKIRE
jgi:hypothetical protein